MSEPRLAKSPWSDVIGPFYAEPGLLRRGLDPNGESVLIETTTSDDVRVFPTRQFIHDGDRIEVSPNVEQAWLMLRDSKATFWNAARFLFSPQHPEVEDAPLLIENLRDNDPASQIAVRALAHVREWVHRLEE